MINRRAFLRAIAGAAVALPAAAAAAPSGVGFFNCTYSNMDVKPLTLQALIDAVTTLEEMRPMMIVESTASGRNFYRTLYMRPPWLRDPLPRADNQVCSERTSSSLTPKPPTTAL